MDDGAMFYLARIAPRVFLAWYHQRAPVHHAWSRHSMAEGSDKLALHGGASQAMWNSELTQYHVREGTIRKRS